MTVATLNVTHADNEVIAFLNGLKIYDHKTEKDPTLKDSVDLTPYLTSGVNLLVLAGINWGGGANFSGSVVIGDITQPFTFKADSTENGVVWHQTFIIPAKS